MSKYNTDGLCGSLGYWRNRLKDHHEWDESGSLLDDKAMAEIKRRLREADNLCEAAKHRIESSEIGVGCNIGLQKAIKKYEGA